MARVLTAEWQRVASGGREAATAAWRARRDHLAAQGCHFWVFEREDDPGLFLEFAEAPDAPRLRDALAGAGLSAPVRILNEVELP